MSSHIPESDWRHFKRVHQDLEERFSSRILSELDAIVQSPDSTALDRYLRVYNLLRNRSKEMSRAFDDFRRSTAIMQLRIMRAMGLLTDNDLKVFSEQTQKDVRVMELMFRVEPECEESDEPSPKP